MTTVNNVKIGYVGDSRFIGRPTVYGNPYRIGPDGTREEVIEKFERYFHARLNVDGEFVKDVEKLRGKVLLCYCYPQKCHGDVLADYLNQQEKNDDRTSHNS